MWNVIECSGHPRDLGFEQGLALRSVIRERVAKAGLPLHRRRWPDLSPFASGSARGSGVGREMIRHFTHLAERADGLARGALVPVDSLLRLLEPAAPGKAGALGLSAGNFQGTTGAGLLRTLSDLPGVVRRSRPEVGFASVEVSAPWQVSALAGINEAGLAVSLVPTAGESQPPAQPLGSPRTPLPLADFLVQECLQRFEDVEAGIGWCLNRPAAGEATILMADAAGNRCAVHFGRGGRTAERADGAVLLAGTPAAELAGFQAWALAGDAAGPESPVRAEGGGWPLVRLVCSARRLELLDADGRERTLSLCAD